MSVNGRNYRVKSTEQAAAGEQAGKGIKFRTAGCIHEKTFEPERLKFTISFYTTTESGGNSNK